MKSLVNNRHSETQPRNDNALHFSDQAAAEEISRLRQTTQNNNCTRWKSIFDAPASTFTPDS